MVHAAKSASAIANRNGVGSLGRVKTVAQAVMWTLLVLPAVWLVLFGPRTTRNVPADRIVVTYWEKWTDFEGEAMRDLIGVFNRTTGADKGIYVDYVVTTQPDLKALVAIAGGDPPDLVGFLPHNVISFAARGALQDLTDRAEAAGIGEELIVPVYYQGCRYHDRLYALPLTPWSIALYYNKGIFRDFADELRRAGLNPERPPATLDEMAKFCRIIQRDDAAGNLDLMAFLPGVPETTGWYWQTWGLWYGGVFYDFEADCAPIDSEPYIKGYEWIRALMDDLGQKRVLRFESGLANFNSPDNPFMRGKLAMVQQGPWFANMIRQYAPELDYAAAPFPTADGREISYNGQDVITIPFGAKHPDEAWAFLEGLYSSELIVVPSGEPEPRFGYEYCFERRQDAALRRPMPPLRPIEWLCWAHYKNGPLAKPTKGFIETHPNPAIAVHERLARSPLAMREPAVPNWTEVSAEFIVAYRDIWGGTAQVRERFEECRARVDVLLAQARERQRRYGVAFP